MDKPQEQRKQDLAKNINMVMESLVKSRANMDALWDELEFYVYPTEPDPRKFKLYTTEGIKACKLFSTGMTDGYFPDGMPFGRIHHPDAGLDKMPSIRAALEVRQRRLFNTLESIDESNWPLVKKPAVEACGVYGTTVMFGHDVDDKIVFSVPSTRALYVMENSARFVDTVFMREQFTAAQAVERFGDKVSDAIKKASETDPSMNFTFIMGIFPHGKFKGSGLTLPGMDRKIKYEEVWAEAANGDMSYTPASYSYNGLSANAWRIVKETAYYYKPFAVWRFDLRPGSPYGWGPGATAITDIKQLDMYSESLAVMVVRQARPPWVVSASMNGKLGLDPDQINYVDDQNMKLMPQALLTGNYPAVEDATARKIESIRDAFFNNLFTSLQTMAKKERMSIYEVQQLTAEATKAASGLITRLDYEFMPDLINMVEDILKDRDTKAGIDKEDPFHYDFIPKEAYQQKDRKGNVVYKPINLRLQFTGPLATLRRSSYEASAILGAIQSTAPLAGIKPDIVDNNKFDEIYRDVQVTMGMPAKYLSSPEDVQQIRDGRIKDAQNTQAMAMQAQSLANAKTAAEAGKTAKEADLA